MDGGPDFIHLNCHSAYSLLEGALPIGKLIDLAVADGMPAVGVTDTANLFGALEFSQKAAKAGIQPLIGCKLPVRFEPEDPGAGARGGGERVQHHAPVFLLAADEDGYRSLVKLVSRYYLNELGRALPLELPLLEAAAPGLVALTGGHDGPLYPLLARGDGGRAEARLARLRAIFGDRLYVALERHGMAVERQGEGGVVALAYAMDCPLVATNEPFFPAAADHEAHDALLAIAEGRLLSQDDRRRLTPEHHFAARAAMVERFADVPEALASTVEIAIRCRARPLVVQPILPRFAATAEDPDEAAREEAAELRRQAVAGLEARLGFHGLAPGRTRKDYEERLEFELGIIERMRYPGYFLIVSDFIKWAKEQGIPVGPGRGSGAGSLVAWSLTITDLDPLRFALLFERFLNPERVSMPDFDIDFCQERRDEVIAYVQKRYGADRVAQIITFGTLQARAALRDVGRVLEMPYGQVDRLCKMVPADPANPVSLADAVAGEPRFAEAREAEPVVDRLLATAMKLEGLYRHASTHAAGLVIGERALDELVPLYRDPRSPLPVTQFNMKWVEQAGLVKFDFLGLKTLTVLQKAVELIERSGRRIDLSAIPLDDAKTYEMLAHGETVGVFQVESQGMRRALAGMKADRFEDIIALVALYRPGPMDNIPTYNRRKHGEEEPDYLHPMLRPILEETYGVIIYQEQVMQIAQALSGYSLGEADLLRRAMGKKIKEEMDAQRARFVDGAVERGIGRADAVAIFDLVAKFASYGFNKSHAAAYALVSYQTAYLKANFPVEFLAASMTLDMGNTDKLNEFRLEARRLGIEVVPPDVNSSGSAFDARGGRIVYALAALKGVGTQVIDHIVAVRDGRPFASLADFADRIDPRQANRRSLECLVQAGAFDRMEPNRAKVFANIGRILAAAQEKAARTASGVADLFGGSGGPQPIHLVDEPDWTPAERLQREFAATGAYLSAHPLDEYGAMVAARGGLTWLAFAEQVRSLRSLTALIAATVVQRQERRTKSGNRIGIVTLSDPTGQFEAVVYQERLFEWRDRLEPGQSLLLQIGADFDAETEEIRARILGIDSLEDVAASRSRQIRVFVDTPEPLDRVASRLDAPGESTVSLVLLLDRAGREVEIRLPGQYRVTPQVAGAVKAVPGVVHVEYA
ncbi:DNA polymerase III subunit alpha [Propylenella binzhouense]|uniref:DNA polymerase III subunit alpha n=1 Tax=Propylenella binzhouense TaxID=2555902 RepID=A0A964T3K6_9HYPH|nr:DNA polymerase III subunit alpha [Propylenella binzhouense]MYZ47828.1 DNA polymerase III subunit alpha [Propylenella binzhouense]